MLAVLTQAQWRAMIDEQVASGQTTMAFCAQRGIDNNYFSTRKVSVKRCPNSSTSQQVNKLEKR